MAAPVVAASGTYLANAYSSSAAVPVPPGVAPLDLVGVVLLHDQIITALPTNFATHVTAGGNVGGSFTYLTLAWKRASASDTGTYGFTFAASANRQGQAFRITGAVTDGDPFRTAASTATAASSSGPTPSVSLVGVPADDLLFFATSFVGGAAGMTFSMPAYTLITPSSGQALEIARKAQTVTGDTGSVTGTWNFSVSKPVALLTSIKPVGPAAVAANFAGEGTASIDVSERESVAITFTSEGTASATIEFEAYFVIAFTSEGTASAELHATGNAPKVRRVTQTHTADLLCHVNTPLGQYTYLDMAGRTTALTYTWDYPGGPTSAEISLDAPADMQIPALSQGATLTVHRGTSPAWTGTISTIERGTPWRIQIDGLAGLATQEPVTTTGTLDSIVDACITAGLPWKRPATLGGQWMGNGTDQDIGNTMLDEVLANALTAIGKRWMLDLQSNIRSISEPTIPTLIVRADHVPPLTLNDYATVVTAKYSPTSTTKATVTVKNQAAINKFGRVPKSIDLGAGVQTSAVATTQAQAYLDRVSPRMTVAGDFVVAPGQITTASGAPVDLPGVRPGVMARLQLVSLIRDAMVVPTLAIDMVIGRTRFDNDDNLLTLSPADKGPSTAEIMFGRAGGGDVAG